MRRLSAGVLVVGAAAALACGATPAGAAACAPKASDPAEVVRRMYVDLAAGDRARTLAAFDRHGYVFDHGTRYTPEAITDLILRLEAAGTTPRWSVEQPDSHAACDMAWIAWTNHGTFTSASGTQPRTWLESAVLVWRDGAWKIRFFHSTPVPQAPGG